MSDLGRLRGTGVAHGLGGAPTEQNPRGAWGKCPQPQAQLPTGEMGVPPGRALKGRQIKGAKPIRWRVPGSCSVRDGGSDCYNNYTSPATHFLPISVRGPQEQRISNLVPEGPVEMQILMQQVERALKPRQCCWAVCREGCSLTAELEGWGPAPVPSLPGRPSTALGGNSWL